MFKHATRNAGFAILATLAMGLSGAGFSTSAQAAPINLNPLPVTDTALEVDQVKFKKGFRGHRGGFRGHRGGFRGHHFKGRGFAGSRFYGKRYSGSHFRGHRFSGKGSFKRHRGIGLRFSSSRRFH